MGKVDPQKNPTGKMFETMQEAETACKEYSKDLGKIIDYNIYDPKEDRDVTGYKGKMITFTFSNRVDATYLVLIKNK